MGHAPYDTNDTPTIFVSSQKYINPLWQTKFFIKATKSMDSLARSLVHLGAITK
jgi:hypothetical protein